MFGLTVDSWELFESLPENDILCNVDLQIDAELLSNPLFADKHRKINYGNLSVRNPVSARMNRLILESEFKVQTEYLDSLSRQTEIYHTTGAKKILFDFDIAGVLPDENLCCKLQNILASIKGIMYDFGMKTELLFRLPAPDMEETIIQSAIFRHRSLLGMNYAIDMHIHENNFDRDEICNMILPIEFDISTVNFIYDAALGNKINPNTLQKTADHLNSKGTECNFFICPSGNVNFQSVKNDLKDLIGSNI